ncbi:MAG TPA: hypothetical protein VMV69_29160 [Pirellulales bacterium]|nr:hypothetical protein [Pirellulales bacterium]
MNLSKTCVPDIRSMGGRCPPYEPYEAAADRPRGGVWLLADVLPELLAQYQVSDDEPHEQDWIDPIPVGEPVACGAG